MTVTEAEAIVAAFADDDYSVTDGTPLGTNFACCRITTRYGSAP
jgi:hypothetical protein